MLLSLSKNTYSFESMKDSFSDISEPQNNSANAFIFFPQAGVGIDAKIYGKNSTDHKMETRRIVDIDALKLNNFVFSFYLNEFLIFNNAGRHYIKPYSINYSMDFGNFRWESAYGILSLFFDHNCSNIFNENETDNRQLRWYGAGIRWESYGMQTGRKDIRINFIDSNNFKFLYNFNYKLSIERKIQTQAFNYNYLITGNLRYDILSYYFLIPYIEGSFTSLINDKIRFNRSLEAGIRMHFNKGDVIPFAGISHKHDIDYYNGKQADLYYIGLAMETLLGNNDEITPDRSKSEGPAFPEGPAFSEGPTFPDFHFSGSYGKFIKNDNLNFNTDIFIGIDFTNPSPISPFLSSRLIHNSQRASAGMFPRYIQSNLEVGFSYRLKFINTLIELYYDYFRYDEGNYYHGHIEEFTTVGLRVKSETMKTGLANYNIYFNKSSGFEWINRVDWQISGQRTVNEKDYKYVYEYIINLRWDIFRFKVIIPYLSAGICLFKDKNYDKVYNIEHGVRIQNGLYWMLFYRYEYRTAVEPDNGLFREYHLFGIRIEI